MPRKGANKKRSVSGRRGKPAAKKKKTTPSVAIDNRGIWGILLFAAGVLSFACQFIPSNGGVLELTKYIIRGLGGQLCLLLPILLCLAGAFLTFGGTMEFLNKRIVIGSLMVFWMIETLLQILRCNNIIASLNADGSIPGWLSFMGRSFQLSSLESSGGGWIGSVLAWPLYRAFDIWGGAILITVTLIVILMIVTGVSFGSVGARFSEWTDDFRVSLGEKIQGIRDRRELLAEQRLEREQEKRERQEALENERASRKPARDEPEPEETELEEPEVPLQGSYRAEREEPYTPKKEEKLPFRTEEWVVPAEEKPVLHILDEETASADYTAKPVNHRVYDTLPLYIAPEDEFSREKKTSPTEPRQDRQGFMEEAEDTFKHGIRRARKEAKAASPAVPGTAQDWDQASAPAASGSTSNEDAFAETEGEKTDTPAYETVDQEPDPVVAVPDPYEEEEEPEEEIPGYQQPAEIESPRTRETALTPQQRTDPAAAEEREPIAALREHRLDATPVVMPAKDTHESIVNNEAEQYEAPPIELLERSRNQADPQREMRDRENGEKLIATLNSFGVKADLKTYTHGPAITRFEIQPAPGVKVSRITTLADDIALNLAADGVRIEAPVPGKPVVGIEVPNSRIETVCLREMIESEAWRKENSPTAVALGKGISGNPVIADMAKMPHVLIAGATGSGKSVCINTIIQSILFHASPREVRLILIDPKVVELSVYNGIPHLLIPVVTDPKKASAALSWAVVEMEHRYKQFETMRVRDIKGYNAAIGPNEQPMAKIIVIIDELADLMMVAPGEVEESICRLAQLARAAGIHLVIATQRPSVNVITGVIKANIPSRIAFAVSSQIDSRTILDAGGAEKLLGKGDMLYSPQGAGKPTRVQGCFVSDDEVQRVVNHVKNLHEEKYDDEVIAQLETANTEDKSGDAEQTGGNDLSDEMLVKAIELAIDAGQVSISMLQRRLRVGYARAGRLVDEMTQMGITGEAEGPTKPRKVLITRDEWKQMQENNT